MKVLTSTHSALALAAALAVTATMASPSVGATSGSGSHSAIAPGDRLATPYTQGFEHYLTSNVIDGFADEDMIVPTTPPGFGVVTTAYSTWSAVRATIVSTLYPGVGQRSFFMDKSDENHYPPVDYKVTMQFVDFTDVALRITDTAHPVVYFDIYDPTSGSPVQATLTDYNGTSIYSCQTLNAGWNSVAFDFSSNGSWSGSTQYTKFAITVDNDADCATHGTQTHAQGLWSFDNLAFNGYEVLGVTGSAAISGTAKVKKVLTGGNISATGTDATVSYQWFACTKNVNGTVNQAAGASAGSIEAYDLKKSKCTAISGATHHTFALTKKQKGKYVRVQVTAQNYGATSVHLSHATGKVK